MKTAITNHHYLIIDLAMQDDVSFDQIKQQTGLSQNHVVAVMRRSLKSSSFKRWRKRMNGKKSKHRKASAINIE